MPWFSLISCLSAFVIGSVVANEDLTEHQSRERLGGWFDTADENSDGIVDKDELHELYQACAALVRRCNLEALECMMHPSNQ